MGWKSGRTQRTPGKISHLIHFWPQKEWPRWNTDFSTLTGDLGAWDLRCQGEGESKFPTLPSLGLGLQEGWSLFQPHLGWFWSCWERGGHSASPKKARSKGINQSCEGQHSPGETLGMGQTEELWLIPGKKGGILPPFCVKSVRKSIQLRCVGSEAVHRASPNQTSLVKAPVKP